MSKITNKEYPQKEKITDPQALNDIKAILAQITATNNPAELSKLVSAARNIKSDSAFINNIAEKVEAIALKKQELAESQLNSDITQKTLEQLEKQRERAEAIIQYKMEAARQIQELNAIHDRFKSKLEEYNKLSPPIEAMVKINEMGEEIIDEQAINKNILTKEEIEERRQKFAALKKEQEKVNIILKKTNEEKEIIEKEINDLTEKLKDKNLLPEQIKALEENLKVKKENLAVKNTVVKEVRKVQKHVQKEIESVKVFHQENQEKINKLGDAIEKSKNTIDPNKHQAFKQKHSLLNNQQAAIVNNKNLSSEDQDIRKNICSKINTQREASRIKDSLNHPIATTKNYQVKQSNQVQQKKQNHVWIR
ncbi:hypothetical protein [Candidatus Rickettsia kedanie]|uniref:Uncharacterized protein n=1 Tax=Candidatus Rickettsia kedanie TaxID=3115352 RepID=A0ABP9TS72_9RICK